MARTGRRRRRGRQRGLGAGLSRLATARGPRGGLNLSSRLRAQIGRAFGIGIDRSGGGGLIGIRGLATGGIGTFGLVAGSGPAATAIGGGRGNPVGASVVNQALGLGLRSAVEYAGGVPDPGLPPAAAGIVQVATWSFEEVLAAFQAQTFQPQVAVGGQIAAVEQAEQAIARVLAARAMNEAVPAAESAALAAARNNARVRTGAMRDSIVASAGVNGCFISWGVPYGYIYAHEFTPPAGTAAQAAFATAIATSSSAGV